MTNYIDNGIIKVGVKSFGATLTSIVSKKSGYEFLWQGNPTVWNGQSPILFPIIGKLLNDECIINGKTYSIIRHGLARHKEFEPVVLTENEIVLKLSVAPADMGKVIGKQGKIAKAIRTVVRASASKSDKKILVDIQ